MLNFFDNQELMLKNLNKYKGLMRVCLTCPAKKINNYINKISDQLITSCY